MSKIKKSDIVKSREKEELFYPITRQPILRPRINILSVVLNVLIAVAADLLITNYTLFALSHLNGYEDFKMSEKWQFILLFFILLTLYTMIRLGDVLIFLLHFYQRFMPIAVRGNCVFIPNCSQYMILAIRKYGAIRGFIMGMKRVKRCHDPYGGYDYPWSANPKNSLTEREIYDKLSEECDARTRAEREARGESEPQKKTEEEVVDILDEIEQESASEPTPTDSPECEKE